MGKTKRHRTHARGGLDNIAGGIRESTVIAAVGGRRRDRRLPWFWFWSYCATFNKQLQQAGLTDIDRPLSTSSLNLLPLFQKPALLFPQYTKYPFHYKAGDFPRAEAFYHSALKIPVWGSANDRWIIGEYIKRIKAVADSFQKT